MDKDPLGCIFAHSFAPTFVSPLKPIFLACSGLALLVVALLVLSRGDHRVPVEAAREAAAAKSPASENFPGTREAPDAKPSSAPVDLPTALAHQPLPTLGEALAQPRRHNALGQALPLRTLPVHPDLGRTLRTVRQGDVVRIGLLDGRTVRGRVNLASPATAENPGLGGELTDSAGGSFSFVEGRRGWQGLILLPAEGLAYQIGLDASGHAVVAEFPLGEVVCTPFPKETQAAGPVSPSALAAPPVLSSRPGARGVIYLDFDGETVTSPRWNSGNTIVAASPNFSADLITRIWRRVARDFAPFNLDVTTDLAAYNAANPFRRIRCIITPTTTAAPSAGGVAYVNSFNWGDNTPCWVFNLSEKSCAEAVSHEVGHTLGLRHDGRNSPQEEYYEGHGAGDTGWAPIMGVGYYRNLVQWSRGEYASANNTEDDLAIIAGAANNVGYAADDHGGTAQTATAASTAPLELAGTIERSGDTDVFSLNLAAGLITLNLTPEEHSNLDPEIELRTSSGTVLASSNPPDTLGAALSASITTPGIYYVHVRGTGKPSPPATGYTNYGSLGGYRITGTISSPQPPPPPTGLQAAATAARKVRLTWTQVLGASAYEIRRNGVTVATVSSPSYVEEDLPFGTSYSYTVAAVNAFGTGAASAPASITTPTPQTFILDGEADEDGYLLSSPGMTIYAAVKGTRLYLATWSSGSNNNAANDHFLLLTDALLPSASGPSPWAKAGAIGMASGKPFWGAESSSDYMGAFNLPGGSTTFFKAPTNGGKMEVVVDLVQAFGTMPTMVYVASAAYATPDGGQLNAQAPAGNGDSNIDPSEFLALPVASVRDSFETGVFDVLDPARGFRLRHAARNGTSFSFEAPAVPGRLYQAQSRASMASGAWSSLGAPVRVASGQSSVGFVDPEANGAAKFYRILQVE